MDRPQQSDEVISLKILVLSDSHSSLRCMRTAMDAIVPDAVIHLGDYVSDGEAIASDYPGTRFYQVAGNCDRYREISGCPEVRIETFRGVRFFITHGHLHGVKTYYDKLIFEARKCNASVALFGHTHEAYCEHLDNGMWVMNPGSCGYSGGSVGLVEIDDDSCVNCKIIYPKDLEVL